jgi:heat shock protein HslJ
MTYLERKTEFADHGNWQTEGDGKTLVLLGERGVREQFALRDAYTLRKLDSEGQEIDSKFDYDFKRLTAFAPIEPHERQSGEIALEDTHWKLTGLREATVTASQQQEPYLVLDSKTRRVAGSGGCNRLTGSYHLNGDRLTFDRVAGTMMACLQGMETEGAFLNVLTQVQRWKISGQQMELYDGSGKVVARFEVDSTK